MSPSKQQSPMVGAFKIKALLKKNKTKFINMVESAEVSVEDVDE